MAAVLSDLACAVDPVVFARAAGFPALDSWQQRALRSRHPRQLWLASRQSGKSQTAAILAAHEAVYTPEALVLLLSPTLRQSGELYRKVAGVLSATGTAIDPVSETKLSIELANHSRVLSLPGSSEATVRGFSKVTLMVIDEAARVDDALYTSMRPALAVSGGRIVALTTAWGRRGFFYTAWAGPEADWQRTRVTCQECPRLPAAFLEEERRVLGPLLFSSEYECTFVDAQGSVFRSDEVARATKEYKRWELG
jgi:hypothetical protein